jgi:pimeloyl-ACP methyl ester carboxylesterase
MVLDPDQDPPRFAEHGPVRLAYWDYGTGPHTVLLVMGINMRAAHWGAHFIAKLAERYRVLCFDNRGTGDSTRPVEEITAELWAADAVAVLDAARVEQASVIGFSMGGRVLQQLLVDHPQRVARLVFLSSAFGGPKHVAPTPAAVATFTPQPELSADEQRRLGLIAITGPGFAERAPERFARLHELGANKRTPLSVLIKQLGVGQTTVAERLAQLGPRTMIVHGDSDTLVPMGNGELILEAIPGARWERLPGIGHLPTWEAPERLLELVHEFLPADAPPVSFLPVEGKGVPGA